LAKGIVHVHVVPPEYIVRLVGQVIRVSIETLKIVRALPKTYIAG
jgi:hypothetical protein